MSKPMRILLPLLLIVAVYCALAPIEPSSRATATQRLVVWLGMVFIAGVANVANACLNRGTGSLRRLAFWGMLLKLCMIPFYLIVFKDALITLFGMMMVPGEVFFLPFMAGALVAVDYVLLLFTSSYGFSATVRALKQGAITGFFAVAMIVLHAMFVIDVVAAIVLYVKLRRADDALAFATGKDAA